MVYHELDRITVNGKESEETNVEIIVVTLYLKTIPLLYYTATNYVIQL